MMSSKSQLCKLRAIGLNSLIWYAKYHIILPYLISRHLDQRMRKTSLDISCEPKNIRHILFEEKLLGAWSTEGLELRG